MKAWQVIADIKAAYKIKTEYTDTLIDFWEHEARFQRKFSTVWEEQDSYCQTQAGYPVKMPRFRERLLRNPRFTKCPLWSRLGLHLLVIGRQGMLERFFMTSPLRPKFYQNCTFSSEILYPN